MVLATRQQYLLVDPTTQPLDTMFHAAPRLHDWSRTCWLRIISSVPS